MNCFFVSVKNARLVLSLLAAFAGVHQASAQTFLPQTLGVGTRPYCVAAADVNNDGKLDLISANQSGNSLTVLTNINRSTFTTASTVDVGSYPTTVVAADINGDGKPDLITANLFGNDLTVLTNNGSGIFTVSSSLGVGENPFNVVMVNVNGGAPVDLVCANAGGTTLTLFPNDGSGNFTHPETISVGSGPMVAAADLNGDGRLDLITANNYDYDLGDYGNTLTVLTNNQHGGFTFSQTLTVGSGPFVAAGDVNGDGKPDLISANSAPGANSITVLTNNGNGTFTNSATYPTGQNPYRVVAADVNRDGKTDLTTADYSDGTVTVLTNNGNGIFTFALTYPVGGSPVFVTAADLNGDGAQELVTANWGDDTLTVLMELPKLAINFTNSTAKLSWPAHWPGYVLQQNTNIATANWVNVSNPTGTNQITISPATGNQCYRLRHP